MATEVAPELALMFQSVNALSDGERRRDLKWRFSRTFGSPIDVADEDVHTALLWLIAQGVEFPSHRDLPAVTFDRGMTGEGFARAAVATVANILDYAFWNPSLAELKAAGIRGVSRYLATTGSSKVIDLAEYRALRSAGLEVVLNFENTSSDYLGGYPKGLENGRAARAQARALGHPDERPIIFSIDTGPGPATINYALEYIRGCNDGGGQGPQGCYGTRYVLDLLFDRGWIRVGWQPVDATGWYGNATRCPRAHMYQLVAKPYPQWDPRSYDANELRPGVTDYGQVPTPGPPIPPPVPSLASSIAGPFGALL